MRYTVLITDRAANAAGLPEYQPDNLDYRLSELSYRHLIYADRWLPDGPGLWRAGGYVLRSGWRRYHPTRRRTPA